MLTYRSALLSSVLLLNVLPTNTFASPSPQSQDQVVTETTTAAAVMTTITATPTTVTTYVVSATTPPSPQYTDALDLRTSVLNSTNLYRYQHNATFLAWNESLASYASSYAPKCIWAHSHGPPGENLAHGYPDITSSIDAWGNERALYDFSATAPTGFTEATGHFSQLVWKSTQTVGCAVEACNGENGIAGYFLVCEYWPPGNIEGTGSGKNVFFQQNVQAQVRSDNAGFDEFSATVGATGVGTALATGTLIPTVSKSAMASATGNMGAGRRGWIDVGVGLFGLGAGLLGGL